MKTTKFLKFGLVLVSVSCSRGVLESDMINPEKEKSERKNSDEFQLLECECKGKCECKNREIFFDLIFEPDSDDIHEGDNEQNTKKETFEEICKRLEVKYDIKKNIEYNISSEERRYEVVDILNISCTAKYSNNIDDIWNNLCDKLNTWFGVEGGSSECLFSKYSKKMKNLWIKKNQYKEEYKEENAIDIFLTHAPYANNKIVYLHKIYKLPFFEQNPDCLPYMGNVFIKSLIENNENSYLSFFSPLREFLNKKKNTGFLMDFLKLGLKFESLYSIYSDSYLKEGEKSSGEKFFLFCEEEVVKKYGYISRVYSFITDKHIFLDLVKKEFYVLEFLAKYKEKIEKSDFMFQYFLEKSNSDMKNIMLRFINFFENLSKYASPYFLYFNKDAFKAVMEDKEPDISIWTNAMQKIEDELDKEYKNLQKEDPFFKKDKLIKDIKEGKYSIIDKFDSLKKK